MKRFGKMAALSLLIVLQLGNAQAADELATYQNVKAGYTLQYDTQYQAAITIKEEDNQTIVYHADSQKADEGGILFIIRTISPRKDWISQRYGISIVPSALLGMSKDACYYVIFPSGVQYNDANKDAYLKLKDYFSAETILKNFRIENVDVVPVLQADPKVAFAVGDSSNRVYPDRQLTREDTANLLFQALDASNKDAKYDQAFSDVTGDFANVVNYLASYGFVNGDQDGKFHPERAVSRAEFATLLSRLANLDPPTIESTIVYSDLPATHWAYDDMLSAVQAGYMKGYADGTMKPNQTITTAEAVAMVNRMLGRTKTDNTNAVTLPYTDLSKTHWAYADFVLASGQK